MNILRKIKENKLITFFSFFEGFQQVYGYLLSNNKSILNFNIILILVALLLGFIFLFINNLLISFFEKNSINFNINKFSKKRFIIIFFVLFILWLPVLLAFYPGIFSYDAYRQVPHFTGQNLSSFQPVFHTLIIEFFLFIGNKMCNYELGLLLYSLFQMIMMLFVFAYTLENIIRRINNSKIRKIIICILLLFYGIFPVNSVFSISFTKDVLFSGFILLLIVTLKNYIDNIDSKFDNILFILSSILLMLLKNSSINLYLFFIFMSMIISKGILKKKLFKLELFSIFLYFVIYITIIIIFRPEKNYIVEKYNVPIFNLVYTANQDSKIVENKDLLYDYFPMECFNNDLKSYMKERHNADISKNSIVYCMNNNMDEKRLLSIWFKNGMKYPVYYFDSWNNLTLGSFYLYDTSHANIYLYVKYMGTNSKKMDFMKNVDFHGKLPFVKNIIRKFTDENIQYNKLSFIRFIFQPATYIYFFILLFLLQFKKSNRKDLLLYIPLIWIYISILIGPCVIMRYIYPFVICIPFLFFINFIKEK